MANIGDKILYLVTDEAACRGKDFFESVEAAIKGWSIHSSAKGEKPIY